MGLDHGANDVSVTGRRESGSNEDGTRQPGRVVGADGQTGERSCQPGEPGSCVTFSIGYFASGGDTGISLPSRRAPFPWDESRRSRDFGADGKRIREDQGGIRLQGIPGFTRAACPDKRLGSAACRECQEYCERRRSDCTHNHHHWCTRVSSNVVHLLYPQ